MIKDSIFESLASNHRAINHNTYICMNIYVLKGGIYRGELGFGGLKAASKKDENRVKRERMNCKNKKERCKNGEAEIVNYIKKKKKGGEKKGQWGEDKSR